MTKPSLSQITSGIVWVSLISVANARSWRSVIDHEIYRRSNNDAARVHLNIEVDPTYFPEDHPVAPPVSRPVAVTPVPSPEPTPAPQHSNRITMMPSESPSLLPSLLPSDYPSLAPSHYGPTAAPSDREANVAGNGGCPEGSTLFRANMRDSFGNGWDGTLLKIVAVEDQEEQATPSSAVTQTTTQDNGDTIITVSKTIAINPSEVFGTDSQVGGAAGGGAVLDPLGLVFQGGLQRGSHGYHDFCLKPRRCYDLTVRGGNFLDEVSWDVQPVILGAEVQDRAPFMQGGAPMDCSFSLPDDQGGFFCPITCSNTLSPDHTQAPKIYDNPLVNTADGATANGGESDIPDESALTSSITARSSNSNTRSYGVQAIDLKTYLREHQGGGQR